MDSGIPRDQIFVTTKLADRDQGYHSALEACELSLEKLGLDYVGTKKMKWAHPAPFFSFTLYFAWDK
jgi:diketogulonate reductase-like aldo/keto reductase